MSKSNQNARRLCLDVRGSSILRKHLKVCAPRGKTSPRERERDSATPGLMYESSTRTRRRSPRVIARSVRGDSHGSISHRCADEEVVGALMGQCRRIGEPKKKIGIGSPVSWRDGKGEGEELARARFHSEGTP
jgi:hypothetical protein